MYTRPHSVCLTVYNIVRIAASAIVDIVNFRLLLLLDGYCVFSNKRRKQGRFSEDANHSNNTMTADRLYTSACV